MKRKTHTLLCGRNMCVEKEGNDMDFNNHKNVLRNRFGWYSTVYSCMSSLSLCLCHFQPSKYSISFRAITTSNVHRRRIALNLRARKEKQTNILIHKILLFYATTYATHFETNRITQSIRQIIHYNFIELVLRRISFSYFSFMFVEFMFRIQQNRNVYVSDRTKMETKRWFPPRDGRWNTELDYSIVHACIMNSI